VVVGFLLEESPERIRTAFEIPYHAWFFRFFGNWGGDRDWRGDGDRGGDGDWDRGWGWGDRDKLDSRNTKATKASHGYICTHQIFDISTIERKHARVCTPSARVNLSLVGPLTSSLLRD